MQKESLKLLEQAKLLTLIMQTQTVLATVKYPTPIEKRGLI